MRELRSRDNVDKCADEMAYTAHVGITIQDLAGLDFARTLHLQAKDRGQAGFVEVTGAKKAYFAVLGASEGSPRSGEQETALRKFSLQSGGCSRAHLTLRGKSG